jgi:hypothetical protein
VLLRGRLWREAELTRRRLELGVGDHAVLPLPIGDDSQQGLGRSAAMDSVADRVRDKGREGGPHDDHLLAEVAHAYRAFATQRPGLYASTMRSPDPDDAEHTAASQEALDVALAVMRSYGIEGLDAVHAIRIYRSGLHGFVAQEASGAFGLPESVEESYGLLIDLLDRAFGYLDGQAMTALHGLDLTVLRSHPRHARVGRHLGGLRF